MNNNETKKKITEIINNTRIERIADELIAAGIGDVKEAERKLFVLKNKLAEMIRSFTRMETLYKIKSEEVEIKKHRAEVAEKALYLMARSECMFGMPEDYIEQAEKELSEERKDGC